LAVFAVVLGNSLLVGAVLRWNDGDLTWIPALRRAVDCFVTAWDWAGICQLMLDSYAPLKCDSASRDVNQRREKQQWKC
jgi:hypothetical protein